MNISGSSVLVLGGAGLVGQAVCRELLPEKPRRLILSSLHAAEVDQAIRELRERFGDRFALITPGIRRTEDARGDQKRVVGPAEAVAMGSTYLVVGRPITQATSPAQALREFNSAAAGDC